MDRVDGSARLVRFGIFEADLQTGELHKNGVRVPLQGQPFQVCAILLSHSGELVTREELRQKVWPEETLFRGDVAEYSVLLVAVAAHSLVSFFFLPSDEFFLHKVAGGTGFFNKLLDTRESS
jgi:hypothetical protein